MLTAAVLWALYACAPAEVRLLADLDKDGFHAAGSTAVHVTVTNSNPESVENLILIIPGQPDALLAETLGAGESIEFTGPVRVSADALSLGFVSVTLKYESKGLDSLEQTLCSVRKLEDKVEARLVCALPDRPLSEGESVKVSYTLVNTGETDISEAVITCLPDGFVFGPNDVPVGECIRVERAVPYEALSQVSARADCKSQVSGTPYTFEAAVGQWTVLNEDVRLTVVRDESVKAGQCAHLTLQIENLGTCSYTGLNAFAEGAGRFRGLPGLLAPGGFVASSLVSNALEADTAFTVTLTALREDGAQVSFAAPEVTVKVLPAETGEGLSVEAKAEDGKILVTVRSGDKRLENLRVGTEKTGDIRVLAALEANCEASFVWEPDEAGEYILYARSEGQEAFSEPAHASGRQAEDGEGAAEKLLYGLIGVKRLPLMLFGAFSLAGALMLALLLRKSEKNAGQKPRRGKRAGKAKKA